MADTSVPKMQRKPWLSYPYLASILYPSKPNSGQWWWRWSKAQHSCHCIPSCFMQVLTSANAERSSTQWHCRVCGPERGLELLFSSVITPCPCLSDCYHALLHRKWLYKAKRMLSSNWGYHTAGRLQLNLSCCNQLPQCFLELANWCTLGLQSGASFSSY
jgi:hypothetical protein